MIAKLSSHWRRVRNQMGSPLSYGSENFKVHGYFPSRLETSFNRHESYLVPVLRRLLENSSGAFIDIGVNVGQTLSKILSLDRSRTYLGIEPQLTCCFNIDQFLRLNHLHNATVLPIAFSDINRVMTFYAEGEIDEMATLIAKDTNGKSKTHVQARIGDEVLEELEITGVCALKIDVEGAELQVLHGLKSTLVNKRPPVIFEVMPNFSGIDVRVMHTPEQCQKNQALAEAIHDYFEALGYEIFVINERDGEEIKINSFELNDRDNFVGINYIAYPIRQAA